MDKEAYKRMMMAEAEAYKQGMGMAAEKLGEESVEEGRSAGIEVDSPGSDREVARTQAAHVPVLSRRAGTTDGQGDGSVRWQVTIFARAKDRMKQLVSTLSENAGRCIKQYEDREMEEKEWTELDVTYKKILATLKVTPPPAEPKAESALEADF
ncbi:MAG: hypothetical protein P4M11_03750 [Candidatus Pacebacteria bacterium]|nr:hypothetical protein [Candidatus Paceibacterota bacterium]